MAAGEAVVGVDWAVCRSAGSTHLGYISTCWHQLLKCDGLDPQQLSLHGKQRMHMSLEPSAKVGTCDDGEPYDEDDPYNNDGGDLEGDEPPDDVDDP